MSQAHESRHMSQAACFWCVSVVHGAVQVQRLQRFATYGYLKQVVLKMIAADLAVGSGADLLSEDQCEAISMVTALRSGKPTFTNNTTQTLSPSDDRLHQAVWAYRLSELTKHMSEQRSWGPHCNSTEDKK